MGSGYIVCEMRIDVEEPDRQYRIELESGLSVRVTLSKTTYLICMIYRKTASILFSDHHKVDNVCRCPEVNSRLLSSPITYPIVRTLSR